MFAAQQQLQQLGSSGTARWAPCQAMSTKLILLLNGGHVWDRFSSDQTGTVTEPAAPPAPQYRQQPQPARVKVFNKKAREAYVPLALGVVRAKLFCLGTVFLGTSSVHSDFREGTDFPVSLSVSPSILSSTAPGTDTYHKGV